MPDKPGMEQILSSVIASLHTEIMPAINKESKISLLLIINALKIVLRQMTFADLHETEEIKRLCELTGTVDSLSNLNELLAARIARGDIALDDTQLIEHLRQTTQEHLQIDQPDYISY